MEPRRETGRIEGFSDAVFAIAITLLALDLKVPPVGAPGLLAKLADWRPYFPFLVSFGTIAVMWVLHHRLFSLIRRADGTLFLFNFLVLVGVVTIPFWTAVMVEYAGHPDQRVAAMLHGGMFIIMTVFLNLLWRHAFRHHLLDETADPHAVRDLARMLAIAPILYLLSFFVASVSVAASAALNTVVALLIILVK